jgi:tRNA(Ile)-lysidine synthase
MAVTETRPVTRSDIETLVRDAIATHALAEPGDRILVAWSGGADSTALLLILKSLGFDVVAGHVDHGIRQDSALDAEHCEDLSIRLGVPFKKAVVSVDPPTEARAREVRYQALEEMANAAGVSLIATGHTMDDQAETVIFRMTRGGFPMGIRRRRGRVIRPILDLRCSETEQVCREHGVQFVIDPSNRDLRFTRNRIRHTVMPQLADEVQAIAAAGSQSEAAAQALAAEVDRLASIVGPWASADGVTLDRNRLLELPERIRRRLLRRALNDLALQPSARLVRDIDEKVAGNGKSIAVSGDLAAHIVGRHMRIERSPVASVDLPDVRVTVPGRTVSAEWGLVVEAELVDLVSPADVSHDSVDKALLDAEAIDHDLVLRRRQEGDRLQPLGMKGTKKLQDLFVDLKIPRNERDGVPIFTSRGAIVWVAPIRIDDRFAIKSTSSRALRIRLLLQARTPLFPFLRDD